MRNSDFQEKSRLLLDETIDALRNKPIKSTYLERLIVADKARALYRELPQPLMLGCTANYILENVSCPVAQHDILLGRYVEVVPNEEEEALFRQLMKKNEELGSCMIDGGHISFDWETIVREGLIGYIKKSERELERRLAEGAEKERILVLQGMNLIYRAYRRYILRYADAAEKAGMPYQAQVCRNIADNAPVTFFEAMQLVLFVTNIYSIYSAGANATLCCGRMDDLLREHYERDIASGILTREEAGYIIDDFNCKNAIILGRGEHQMSGGADTDTGWSRNPMYDSPTYVILGGYSNRGDHTTNPLTRLFLERIHPRLENPVYVFRRTPDVADDMWQLICDKLRQNSTLLVYNDETVIPAMINAGIPEYDAREYTIHGCNWPDVHGMSQNLYGLGYPMPRYIMDGLLDEDGNLRRDFKSIDDVYDAMYDECRKVLHRDFIKARFNEAHPASNTLCCTDCFLRGPIDNATSGFYGVKYPIVLTLVRNVGTAADIMAALESVVFCEGGVSMQTMADALKANFVGYEDLWKKCKSAPKYGQDDDRADAHGIRLINLMTDAGEDEAINPETGERDIITLGVTITDMWHRHEGARLGATPDGRLAGMPLSENLSATPGNADSVTALLNTVAKMPFDRIGSGALNLRMPKNVVAGDLGLMRLSVLLKTYFENGGMQVQLSIADTEELRDAQKNPENYRDLMVRITGYSAVFVDMCTEAQNEIIRRDELA